jgi:molybdenum cofactor biosynthesis enzyme MoaA
MLEESPLMPGTHQNIPDIILRASVSRDCNFACVYCPKGDRASGGMENYAPDGLVGKALSAREYEAALRQIRDGLGVRQVTFTGGEPTLNAALLDLLKAAKATFERVEITTNGALVSERLVTAFQEMSLDLVKVSLDSVDPQQFIDIVGVKKDGVFDKVMSSIRNLSESPLAVALNVVVMKRSLSGLRNLTRFAEKVRCPVHLLDYVFYPSKRHDWEAEFVPMEFLVEAFAEEYGPPRTVMRYGCTFCEFNVGGIYVRLKDSMTATARAKACGACNEYCQEGPYGLKLSIEGWVTACPSVDPRKGVALSPGLSNEEAAGRLATLRPMFTEASTDKSSFERFLGTWDLHPAVSREDVRALFGGAEGRRACPQTHSLVHRLPVDEGASL